MDKSLMSPRRYPTFFAIFLLTLLLYFNQSIHPDLVLYNESFRWRKELIGLYASFRFELGDQVFNQTLVGREGWLFFTGEQSVDDYQGVVAIRPGKLARLQRGLDRLNSQLQAQGVQLLVVIPPDKSTIYPQFMPEEIPVTGQTSRLDQFLTYMQANGKTRIIDLRPVLLEASQTQQVYFKTDTHWNDLGAFLAYRAIMQALSVHDPALTPRALSDYSYEYIGAFQRDMPPLMGLNDSVEPTWVMVPVTAARLTMDDFPLPDGRTIRTVTNASTHLPQLLVFGDSFYVSLAPFIEQHFSRTKSIPFTYEPGIWTLKWIADEQPDYVIIEIAERVLDISLPMLLEN